MASPPARFRRRTLVVGGGVVGLRVADGLSHDRQVLLAEAAPGIGGLTSGWTVVDDDGTSVTWDRFYHVVLESDQAVRDYAESLGVSITFASVGAEILARGRVQPMSSALDLLKVASLQPVDRLRVGLTVLIGGLLPITDRTDRTTSARWLRRVGGDRAFDDLWRPLLRAKLGQESDRASAVFIRSTFTRLLRARLSRGQGDRFGWIGGGYRSFLARLSSRLESAGVEIRTGTRVQGLTRDPDGERWRVTFTDGSGEGAVTETFDEVVITLAGPLAAHIIPREEGSDVAAAWRAIDEIPYLGCVCVFVVLSRPVTGGYLTYVTDEAPYSAIVEMTNLVRDDSFNGRTIVYLPFYTRHDDPVFDEDRDTVAQRFVADFVSRYPGLDSSDVVLTRVSAARFVLPVPVPGRRSRPVPADAGVDGLFLASSVQITDGTLNVESSLRVADEAVRAVLSQESRNEVVRDG